MKRINIKYMPKSMETVSFLVCAGIFVSLFILIENLGTAAAVISGVILFALAALLECMVNIKTTIEYGEGDIIKCSWAFIKWEIDLSKMQYVVYKVKPYYSRCGTIHTFNVEFVFPGQYGEERKCLKTNLDADQVGESIQGKRDCVPLMQLYRYAEERYPEKAEGLEKAS